MRRSFRYVVYLMIGFLIYEILESGETNFTHDEVKNTLIIAMISVFVLLLVVKVIKSRYDKHDTE